MDKNEIFINGKKIDFNVVKKENNNDDILKIQEYFKEILKIRNVSFLCGNGTSLILGAQSIADISKIKDNIFRNENNLLKKFDTLIPIKTEAGEKNDLESILNFLYKIQYLSSIKENIVTLNNISQKEVQNILNILQRWLVESVDIKNTQIPDFSPDEIKNGDRFYLHKLFIKKLLTRASNLPRANIFTTNYDLAFEYAMDELGILYNDGFIGKVEPYFHPEIYDYDFYYPGETTEGKVFRVERVVNLYKLHGSIDWVETNEITAKNFTGVKKSVVNNKGNERLLIYPTPMKDEETTFYPYSEMFRRFSNIISQRQSVLITIGYSFGDEHINRLIYQSLSNPTFRLIVFDYSYDKNSNIDRLFKKLKDDPRVSFFRGKYVADFTNIVKKFLPDISDIQDKESRLEKLIKDLLAKKHGVENGEK